MPVYIPGMHRRSHTIRSKVSVHLPESKEAECPVAHMFPALSWDI